VKEFADFLGGQPPFDALDADDLVRLAARVEVEYFDTGAIVVPADAGRLDHLWVVRTGALEVLDRGRLVDLLGPGDTFGHVALLSDLPPGVGVRAHEESLCLRIPDPREYLAHPERLRFAAIDTVQRRSRVTAVAAGPGRRLTRLMRPVVWCAPDDPVREVAARIGAAGLSCAVVRVDAGVGIVTDHDFRRWVATGEVGPDAPVAGLATVPALTVDQDAGQAVALLHMVEHGVHHLVVTGPSGEPVGVVRAVDLAQAEVRDPLLVRAAIETADTLDELAEACRLLPATVVELRDGGVAAPRIGAVYAAVVDAVLRRLLRLRDPSGRDRPGGVRQSWVVLGSLARREPLPLSDVDTALVWDATDRGPGFGPDASSDGGPDPGEAVRAAAAGVLADLRRCGLRPCGNGVNADNPTYARSRADWVSATRAWQRDPTRGDALLMSATVADSRPVTDVVLGRAMTDAIRSRARGTGFLRVLLDEALGWKPPTGFVRGFVVHHGGEHHGQLDLKAGGLAPVVSLARWVATVAGDTDGTTPERLRRGAAAGLLTDDEAQTLTGAFEDVYALLLDHEVAAIRSGAEPSTYIEPDALDTLTRRHLRDTFRAVGLVQAHVGRAWLSRLARAAGRGRA
jgi:CBS domain-containing protein